MKKIKNTMNEFFVGAVLGIVGAIITIPFMDRILQGFKVSHIFAIVVLVVVSFLFSILIHELGHLVMGLMTGYKFLSFRFLTFHVQHDENGKLKLFKQNIPGTMGQCLMIPPNKKPFPMF